MTDGDRVKEIRKSKGLTLEKFGERLGVAKTTISRIENGINGLTDQMCKSISREFQINETWLRTGEGEMELKKSDDAITKFAVENGLDKIEETLIREYLLLKDDDRNVFRKYLKRVLDELNDEAPAAYQEQDQNNSQVVAESHTKYNA